MREIKRYAKEREMREKASPNTIAVYEKVLLMQEDFHATDSCAYLHFRELNSKSKLQRKILKFIVVSQDELEISFVWLLENKMIHPTIDVWHYRLWVEDWDLLYPESNLNGQPEEINFRTERHIQELLGKADKFPVS